MSSGSTESRGVAASDPRHLTVAGENARGEVRRPTAIVDAECPADLRSVRPIETAGRDAGQVVVRCYAAERTGEYRRPSGTRNTAGIGAAVEIVDRERTGIV